MSETKPVPPEALTQPEKVTNEVIKLTKNFGLLKSLMSSLKNSGTEACKVIFKK